MATFKQLKTQEEAVDFALQTSKTNNEYLTVIQSKDDGQTAYFVEAGSPFIRSWETVIGTYENGVKVD